MSQINVNEIYDGNGTDSAKLYGVSMRYGGTNFVNRIINGDMRIAQRGTSFAGLTDGSNQYTLDRWRWVESGTSTGVQTLTQDADAPTGFVNSLKVLTTTAQASLAATNSYRLMQPVEGNNVSDLGWGTANAKDVTLSFWVRSSLTGTFGGNVNNAAGNRYYVFSYSINSADTWEYKTVTIAGDTSGTWLTTNGLGINVLFSMGTGADYITTPGSWGSSRVDAPTGQVNVAGTLNATFYSTGVQLEAGSVATPFERRPFGTELALCQRYYAKMTAGTGSETGFGMGFFSSTTAGSFFVKYPVTMRSSPTVSQSTTSANDITTTTAAVTLGTLYAGLDSAQQRFTVGSGGTANRPCMWVGTNTSAYVDFSAEL